MTRTSPQNGQQCQNGSDHGIIAAACIQGSKLAATVIESTSAPVCHKAACSWQQAGDVTDLQPICVWAMHALSLLDIRAWSGNAFGPAATPVYHGSFACPWLAQMSLADCCHAAHLQNLQERILIAANRSHSVYSACRCFSNPRTRA